MRFHFLFHVPFEGPGTIEPWVKTHGHSLSATQAWLEPFPLIDSFDFLVVMGGPMNIYEEEDYPWLKEEKEFIEKVIAGKKKVLGVCLGAQLIADVLGGKVTRNPQKEIGWFPVEFTPEAKKSQIFSPFPPKMTVFHWHGDTFQIPPGALHIARSKACENQGFVYRDSVVGLQFHLESTADTIGLLIQNCRQDLAQGEYVQSEKEMLLPNPYYGMNQTALGILLKQMISVEPFEAF